MSESFLVVPLLFLASAVLGVLISYRLGLGSVLGYLIAGVLIGPFGFAFIESPQDIYQLSEMGVVFFMFLIGLELNIKKLWELRRPIFGTGGLQVLLTSLLFVILGFIFGISIPVSLFVGLSFSLSSTALGLQILKEKNFLPTQAGQISFSILLFQDIAVIPILLLLPFLSSEKVSAQTDGQLQNLIYVALLFLFLFFIGRKAIQKVLDWVAKIKLREVFTALSLLLVVGMAYLMEHLHMSMALGAFVAGVLLADSEYKHALETDIEPFKGLLLGLFFLSVGMGINLATLKNSWLPVLGLLVALLLVKFFIFWAIASFSKIAKSQKFFFSIVLSQVGEFAFVLFGLGRQLKIVDQHTTDILTLVSALSLLMTPIILFIDGKFRSPQAEQKPQSDPIENQNNPVLIAGFGRFGQIVGRLLYSQKIKATVLDFEPDQIELLRRFGFKIYFGDATRLDLLEAAGIANAKILVVAIDDVQSSLKLIDLVQKHFPNLKIYARARNVRHVYDLLDRNVAVIERETFESSLKMGVEVLKGLGWRAYEARTAGLKFRLHNIETIRLLHPRRQDEKDLIAKTKQSREDLEKMFEKDQNLQAQQEDGWI